MHLFIDQLDETLKILEIKKNLYGTILVSISQFVKN